MPRKLPDYRKIVEIITEQARQEGHDVTVEEVERVIRAYDECKEEIIAKHLRSGTRGT
jgi:hypothetical protein